MKITKTTKKTTKTKHFRKNAKNITQKKRNTSSVKIGNISRNEALIKLNKGEFGLNWKDKAHTFNYPEEHVIKNVMENRKPFTHEVHFKERKPGHKFKL